MSDSTSQATTPEYEQIQASTSSLNEVLAPCEASSNVTTSGFNNETQGSQEQSIELLCTSATNLIDESAARSIDLQNEQNNEATPTEHTDLFIRSPSSHWCCDFYGGPYGLYAYLTRRFLSSKFYLLFILSISAVPIYTGFIGAKYMYSCPANPDIPVYLFLIGMSGTIVVCCRVLAVFQKLVLPNHREWDCIRSAVLFGVLALVLIVATEVTTYHQLKASFEHHAKNYCNERLYNYTFWINWVGFFFVILVCILYAPQFCSQAVDTRRQPRRVPPARDGYNQI